VPENGDVSLPEHVTLTPDQAQEVMRLIQSERAAATLWEYRYLNFFLARSTQLVLDWIGSLDPPTSLRFLDAQLQASVPDANERTAIFAALQNHRLIEVSGDAVRVNPKGKEYLEWRGPLSATTNPG
jgi:hypothetical protein